LFGELGKLSMHWSRKVVASDNPCVLGLSSPESSPCPVAKASGVRPRGGHLVHEFIKHQQSNPANLGCRHWFFIVIPCCCNMPSFELLGGVTSKVFMEVDPMPSNIDLWSTIYPWYGHWERNKCCHFWGDCLLEVCHAHFERLFEEW